MNIYGTTVLTGIFGWPVQHSLSPAMHNAAFKALEMNYVYLPFAIPPASLPLAVRSMRVLGARGVNITIPHKEKVARFLDRVDSMAEKIGSINTIVNDNGILTGYNTDGTGFLEDLKACGVSPKGRSVLLLGAGGAARAIAFALSSAGAGTIRIAARNAKRGGALAAQIPGAQCIPFDQAGHFSQGTDIVVNATPLGMQPGDPSPLAAETIGKRSFVYDIVYNRRTALAAAAAKADAAYSAGLGMLLFQGAQAFKLWTGRKAPVDIMRKALIKALRSNA
jgi:shikimate dehydrogenase